MSHIFGYYVRRAWACGRRVFKSVTSRKTGKYTMPVLHNRISNEELKARMLAETEPRTTVS
ncbi:MAG: hypothetical protein ACTH8A_18805, partial [Serratia proteamaculans]